MGRISMVKLTMKVFATVVSGGKIAQSNEMCKHDGGSGVQNPSKNC